MNAMLGEMEKNKTDFCVMEVSSIALVMDRVYGLSFDTAVYTNLTSEHLDFHTDMVNYFKAKKYCLMILKKTNLLFRIRMMNTEEILLKTAKQESFIIQ